MRDAVDVVDGRRNVIGALQGNLSVPGVRGDRRSIQGATAAAAVRRAAGHRLGRRSAFLDYGMRDQGELARDLRISALRAGVLGFIAPARGNERFKFAVALSAKVFVERHRCASLGGKVTVPIIVGRTRASQRRKLFAPFLYEGLTLRYARGILMAIETVGD